MSKPAPNSLWAWSAVRITRVLLAEGVDPAGGLVHQLAEGGVGEGDRGAAGPPGPSLWEW